MVTSYDAPMIGRARWERLAAFFEDMSAAARDADRADGAGRADLAWARAAALVRAVAQGRPSLGYDDGWPVWLCERAGCENLRTDSAEQLCPAGCRVRYIARFVPQAWVNGQAIEVDPEGPVEWDATSFFASLSREHREESLARIDAEGEALDRYDASCSDDEAPSWSRGWNGPFDVCLRRVEEIPEMSDAGRGDEATLRSRDSAHPTDGKGCDLTRARPIHDGPGGLRRAPRSRHEGRHRRLGARRVLADGVRRCRYVLA